MNKVFGFMVRIFREIYFPKPETLKCRVCDKEKPKVLFAVTYDEDGICGDCFKDLIPVIKKAQDIAQAKSEAGK